ncbi:MAG: helix-turn-helix domain-containing protein [Candidatus Marinimicrobia bacterium]|nr:helix-turn-helix domain-containing protein [Candidatus Neomarinimicrobiota bacterium]
MKDEYLKEISTIGEKFYSPIELSEMLNVSYRKVLDLILLGELSAYRIGGVYRVSQDDLNRYLQSSKVEVFHLPNNKY